MKWLIFLNYDNRYQSNGKCSDQDLGMGKDQIPLYSLGDVQLRFLCPDDLDEVRALCQDWFPIEYPFYWYEEITSSTRYLWLTTMKSLQRNWQNLCNSSRFYSLAAVYNQAIIGLIVAEIKPYASLNEEDTGILAKKFAERSDIAYILSLGVLKQYRRNGIASLLLDSLIKHLTTSERKKVKAVFLHVLTTNSAAIKFYEHRKLVQGLNDRHLFSFFIIFVDLDFTVFCLIIILLKVDAKMGLCMFCISMGAIHRGQSNILFIQLFICIGFFLFWIYIFP